MKTITVRVSDDKSTEMLAELLKSLRFVESVDVYDEENELTAEEINMVEESWEEYKQNPSAAKSWEEVKKNLLEKYGK